VSPSPQQHKHSHTASFNKNARNVSSSNANAMAAQFQNLSVDSPTASENDYGLDAEAREALSATNDWYPRFQGCNCCKGYIYNCQDATCQALGTCGCAMGQEMESDNTQKGDEDEQDSDAPHPAQEFHQEAKTSNNSTRVPDETWRDEWFPNSRTCKCCEGYIYRCSGTECTKTRVCTCANAAPKWTPTATPAKAAA
jgi:hypothetical protein